MKSTTDSQYYEQWLKAVEGGIRAIGSDGFYAAFCDSFTRIPGVGHPLLLYFPDNARAQALYHTYTEEENYQQQVGSYLNGRYVLDPFYQASLKDRKPTMYRLSEVAPDNFRKTEYFRRYYKAINFLDEICFIQPLPGGHAQLSLGPEQERGRFSRQIVRLLASLSPVANALMLKHWSFSASEQAVNSREQFHQTLQQALQCFGKSILTPREQAVLQLVLHGHSNRSAAERLGISLATVKLHRKHIYRKLDISSQSELFYLFIDSLSCIDAAEDGDPLRAYMSVSA